VPFWLRLHRRDGESNREGIHRRGAEGAENFQGKPSARNWQHLQGAALIQGRRSSRDSAEKRTGQALPFPARHESHASHEHAFRARGAQVLPRCDFEPRAPRKHSKRRWPESSGSEPANATRRENQRGSKTLRAEARPRRKEPARCRRYDRRALFDGGDRYIQRLAGVDLDWLRDGSGRKHGIAGAVRSGCADVIND